MKKIIFTLAISFLCSGCYQRMPTVGYSAPRVHHKKVCRHDAHGNVRCTTTSTWTR